MACLSLIVVPGYPHYFSPRGVRAIEVFHSAVDRREYLGMIGGEITWHGVPVSCTVPENPKSH